MRCLIDSDVIIDALDDRFGARAALDVIGPQHLSISVISVGELLEGMQPARVSSARRQAFESFLEPLQLRVVDARIMVRFAAIRSELRQRGNLIADFDIVIAATAMENNLTLLTRNQKHFGHIAGLRFESPAQVLRDGES